MPRRLEMWKFFFGLVIIFFLLLVSPFLVKSGTITPILQSENELELDFSQFVSTVNIAAVREHVEFFSSFTTRATGYLGNEIAAQYIYDFFMNLTLPPYGMENVSFHEFPVTDCIDLGANLTVLSTGDVLKIYPLLPNLVCPSTTPPEGITGKIVYAGEGRIEEFDGLEVEGSIVLMDWNSMNRWLNAAKLGAKAVVFVQSAVHLPSLTGSMCTKWLSNIPLNFPRFYADENGANLLRGHLGEEVKLVSTQQWKSMTGKNVLGFVEGTEYPDQYIVLSSYYDSYSIAPSIAPGAQEACGISALLELAEYLSLNPPKYTIIFVAFGGHNQFLAGSFGFVYDYQFKYEDSPETRIGDRIVLEVNLDFSTGSKSPFITTLGGGFRKHQGAFHANYFPLWQYLDNLIKDTTEYEVRLSYGHQTDFIGMSYELEGGHYDYEILSWKEFPYDSETFMMIKRSESFCITTAYDNRPYYWEPFDTIEKLNFNNLKTQLEFTHILLIRLLNEDDIVGSVLRRAVDYPEQLGWRNKAVGTVAVWNTTKNFYDPVPNALVYFEEAPQHPETSYPQTREGRWINYYWWRRFTFSDDEGRFTFLLTEGNRPFSSLRFSAWIINETTGNVLYAPDFGIHAWPPFTLATPTIHVGFVTIFKVSMIGLFDIMSPDALKLPTFEGNFLYPRISLFETQGHLSPASYGSWVYQVPGTSVLLMGVPPETPVEIMWRTRVDRFPLALLVNASLEAPLGQGYVGHAGEQLLLPMTSLHFAENFYWVNENRLDTTKSYLPNLEPHIEENEYIRYLLDEAQKSLASSEFSKAQALCIEAWQRSSKLYNKLRPMIEDTAFAVPFLAFFLIPFTILAERLIFRHGGLKRVISFLGVFLALLISYVSVHPGFNVAASPTMIIMGFTILILVTPLLAIVSQHVTKLMKAIRTERLGKHEAEISRTSEMVQSFIIGVGHMRRTRLRTILTLSSIILMVAGLISIVSISKIEVLRGQAFPGQSEFEGIYLHTTGWEDGRYGMGETLIEVLNAKYGGQATIAPEAWRLTNKPEVLNPYRTFLGHESMTGFRTEYNGKVTVSPMLVGLTSHENEFGAYSITLEAGRWFVSKDRKALVLNELQAETLGIRAEDIKEGAVPHVLFEGEPFTVIGIVSMDLDRILGLDGNKITPVKFDVVPNLWLEHVFIDEILILPYETVIAMGGDVASVSMTFKNPESIPKVAEELIDMLPTYEVYSSHNQQVSRYSREGIITTWGFQHQLVPMVIVILTVFNIILGNVYERRREIVTYGTIGLSPLHISLMFLAETASYAIVGGIIGYLTSLVLGKLANLVLPGAVLANYSSSTVLMSLAGSMGATVLSSVYPIFVASRMITPSLERKWKIPTNPIIDFWEIPLPFYAASDQEAGGIIKYLNEYMDAHKISDAPDFYILDLKLSAGTNERGEPYKSIAADLRLSPHELGVVQTSTFSLVKGSEKAEHWRCFLVLSRKLGTREEWVRLNHYYVDTLRKQLLLWRSLKHAEREQYMKEA